MSEPNRSLPKMAVEQQKNRFQATSAAESSAADRSPLWIDLGPADWRRPVRVLSFIATTIVLILVVRFSLTSVLGQALDQLVLEQAKFAFPQARTLAWPIARSISVLGIVFITCVTFLIAIVKKRLALGLRMILLVVGANFSTQVVKHFLLDRPYLGVGFDLPNSLPSGHVTVALCVAIALTVVSPQKIRVPVAFLGIAFAAAVSLSVVLLGWHRPSDVVAAVLITFWWALILVPHERPQGFGNRINTWFLVFNLITLGTFLALGWYLLEDLRSLVALLVSLPRGPGEVTEAGIPLVVFQEYDWLVHLFAISSLVALIALVGFVIHFVVLLESGNKNKHYI
ncbi:phosphatase PAP2 family protein [Gleimia sp. 6138-11-ORH1]|uniref:phosphatase PAP2 family protein n=1 Tax=Gleimia sp. 6138-11-ORH1 TaxID=2973937 RepID=UPI00216A604F|nr:phosphatase PAP2 family protein [Gleimia sp. 6138-11-ORH1]MCS4484726.1 phosphatase PAP2 family protein [Gleimia sp. 6138-11-ORH1]